MPEKTEKHEKNEKKASKFDLQAIMDNVKSLISPINIPEASKDQPIAFLLAEMNNAIKEAADLHSKQADAYAKLNGLVGELHTRLADVIKAEVSHEKHHHHEKQEE